jgi:hypothetical protein
LNVPRGVALDAGGNVYIVDTDNYRLRFMPKTSGTYFGQPMTANYIYTLTGAGGAGFNSDNVVATTSL